MIDKNLLAFTGIITKLSKNHYSHSKLLSSNYHSPQEKQLQFKGGTTGGKLL